MTHTTYIHTAACSSSKNALRARRRGKGADTRAPAPHGADAGVARRFPVGSRHPARRWIMRYRTAFCDRGPCVRGSVRGGGAEDDVALLRAGRELHRRADRRRRRQSWRRWHDGATRRATRRAHRSSPGGPRRRPRGGAVFEGRCTRRHAASSTIRVPRFCDEHRHSRLSIGTHVTYRPSSSSTSSTQSTLGHNASLSAPIRVRLAR